MVDRAKALVNITRLPYWLLDELKALGIETIHCWPSEGHAVNSLALRPGHPDLRQSPAHRRTAQPG